MRVIERQPVVALSHGVVGVLERGGGGSELGGCVAIGAGSARGIDRALGLIHFLVGRRCARGGEHDEEARQTQRGTRDA